MLHACVMRDALRPEAEAEDVAGVRAVPHQEGPVQTALQLHLGVLPVHRTPVPATLPHNTIQCEWTAFIQRFPNPWPLNALYSIASQSPVQTPIQTHKVTAGLSGEVGVRASHSGTPRHSARRSRGLNQQPCGYRPTRSTRYCRPNVRSCNTISQYHII